MVPPAPAHAKSRRAGERVSTSRDISSVQPLAPTSRRISQQQREVNPQPSAGLAPHPYAAPSATGYRSQGAGFGRHSPNATANGNGLHLNGSDPYLYGQPQPGKAGTNSRETTTAGTATREIAGGARGMGVYDREQMQRVGEQDEDVGHGRRRGFWSALCCRG